MYVSIHGICFDEGQSGNCGLECRGFLSGQCEIPDELVESMTEKEKHEALCDAIGELRAEVIKQSGSKIEVLPLILESLGYASHTLNNGEQS